MKKVLSFLLVAVFAFGLAACGETDPVEQDTTSPTFSGVEDVTIYKDSTFNPLDGVTATDDVDGDVTDSITVTGSVDVTTSDTYFLRYSVSDEAGNTREETRYVTVEIDPALVGDEMVPNGDFELGWDIWTTTTGLEGGNANFSVVDGELVIEVTSVSGGLWEPRLENRGISFENGVTYEVSFDARAAEPRAIHLQVGEIIDAAPWFTNFKEGQTEIFDLSTTMETYSFKFTMSLDSNDNGALIFEMGTVPANDLETSTLQTTIYLDNVAITEATPDPDTTGPVISGVGPVLVDQGETFDPLAGVTAFDGTDGDVSDSVTVSGFYNTNILGEYTLYYRATDSLGNETLESREMTVREPLALGSSGTTYGWRTFMQGAAGELLGVDGAMLLDLTSITGVSDNWHVQVIQDAFALGTGEDNVGSMQFEADKTYRVTFDASASVAGDVNLAIGHAGGGWTGYHSEAVSITTEMDTYTVEFTLDDAAADYTPLAQFKFELGTLFSTETAAQFMLDNVMIEEVDGETVTDAELIENGDFEIDLSYGWRAFLNSWEGTAGELLVIEEQLVLDLTAINAYQGWTIQIIQDAFALGTGPDNAGSIQFEADKTYKVTFDAKSSVAGDAKLAIGHNVGGSWTPYYEEVVAVTTDMDTYTVEFTLDDTEADYTPLAQFKLEMGDLFNGEATGQFTLDNVKIEEIESEVVVASNFLVNGDLDQDLTEGWRAFLNSWEGTAGELVAIDNMLLLDLTAINAYQNWTVQIIQDAFALGTGPDNAGSIQFEADKTYKVTFDAKASLAGDVNLAIGHAGGGWTPYYTELVAVTTDMATYEVEFTLDDDTVDYTTLAQFKLEMGDLFNGEATGQFMLDNVMIEEVDGETLTPTGFIHNGDFEYELVYLK